MRDARAWLLAYRRSSRSLRPGTPARVSPTHDQQAPNPTPVTPTAALARVPCRGGLTLRTRRRTAQVMVETVAQEFRRLGLGEVRAEPWLAGADWSSRLSDSYHHMGTTRLGSDPKSSVVNRDCRVHGMEGLYVAGSSVFPASGFANPTLTLTAMAIRLSDHLKDVIDRAPLLPRSTCRTTPLAWDTHTGPHPERADTLTSAAGSARWRGRFSIPGSTSISHGTLSASRATGTGWWPGATRRDGSNPALQRPGRAVFKCYGSGPRWGAGRCDIRPHRLLELAQYMVRWMRWLPGGAAHARRLAGRRLRGRPAPPPIEIIPIGTYNQLELPMLGIEERPMDLFFAGSVDHRHSLRRLVSPKTRSRREMLAAVRRLGLLRPRLALDMRVTDGFAASAAGSPEVYSRALMDSRVCLAPRGTSVETCPRAGGLRAGCIVVASACRPTNFTPGADPHSRPLARPRARARAVLDDPAALKRRPHRGPPGGPSTARRRPSGAAWPSG